MVGISFNFELNQMLTSDTGLGVMGYPMAKNLRKGLGSDQNLVICDINKDAIARFQEETAEYGPVGVVTNGFEAAKTAVRIHLSIR